MRQILLSYLIFFSTNLTLLAQIAGEIAGSVHDAQTGEPLVDVNVFAVGTARGDVTDFAGRFLITGIRPGRVTVRASHLGYSPFEIEVEVQPSSRTLLSILLNEAEAIRLEEIVVTAQRANVYPQTDIRAVSIAQSGRKDVGEFLRSIPGASAIKKGGTALDPVIRGFRQDQLNVQVDGGIKVWGACPNRMDPPTSHIQSEDLEKIEILKGPFSVRFGPSFGAVVNLVMERPERSSEARLKTRIDGGYESNWNGKRARVTVTGGTQLVDFYASGGIKDYGSYTTGEGSSVEAGFRMKDYSIKAGANPSDRHRLQLMNRGSFMRDVRYPALPMDAYLDDTWMWAFDYAGRFDGNHLSSASIKFYHSDVHHVMGNQRKPTAASLRSTADVRARTVGGRTEITVTPMTSTLLYVGADGYELFKWGDRRREFLTGPMAGQTRLDTLWPDARIRSIGLFAEGRLFPTASLTAITGLRFDNVSIRSDRPNAYFRSRYPDALRANEQSLSGVIAFLYTISPSLHLKGGIGHGVRSADLTERFCYIQPIGMDRYDYIGNPELKPERNTQLELSLGARLGTAALQFSFYRSSLRDLISAEVDASLMKTSPDALGVKRFVNIGRATMMGYEADVATPLTAELGLRAAAAYTRGHDEEHDQPLAEIPPLSASAALRYHHHQAPVWAELEARAVAGQDRVSPRFMEVETPGYMLISLRAGAEFQNHVEVTLGVSNILNKTYYEHLNRKSKSDGRPIVEPGRAFNINVSFSY